MNNQNKNCSLHANPFEYFCQKCYEPVCRQCTIIGPHNTPIHSISNLASAYERRVHEIKQRISAFLENKPTIMSSIQTLNSEIQQLKYLKDVGLDENQRYKSKMCQQLQQKEERIRNQICLIKEGLQSKVNSINDLGHSFECLTDHIEIISSHSHVLHSIKEIIDRVGILLGEIHLFPELPKELSDLRLDLKNIEMYQELIDQKTKLIKQIFNQLQDEIKKIEKPAIDFDSLLKQLSDNIDTCIEHNVCHFCGTIFTFDTVNTPCTKNNSALDINQYKGFCKAKPESIRWATHRHYFSQPEKKLSFFHTKQLNSFSINMKTLLLKLKTICMIKNINLAKQFKETDKKNTGMCNKIEMMYLLKERCGLNVDQSEIILTLCEEPRKSWFVYGPIVDELFRINIDRSEKDIKQEIGLVGDLMKQFK